MSEDLKLTENEGGIASKAESVTMMMMTSRVGRQIEVSDGVREICIKKSFFIVLSTIRYADRFLESVVSPNCRTTEPEECRKSPLPDKS